MDGELKAFEQKAKAAIDHFHDELKKIRTGRANPQVLDGIEVEVYGQMTPLQHIANVNAVDAQMLQITPYDPNNLNAISAAIRNDSTLGLNPADDGKVVRVPMPPLTEERRQEIAKGVGEKAEEAKISLRNARRDVLDILKGQKDAGDIDEDSYRRLEKNISEQMDKFQKEIDDSAAIKEKEILTV